MVHGVYHCWFWQFFLVISFFFFYVAATTEIYTLSLHDALPIFQLNAFESYGPPAGVDTVDCVCDQPVVVPPRDRKSTRLNSSHGYISYAVFCLKKKKKNEINHATRTVGNHSCAAFLAAVKLLFT